MALSKPPKNQYSIKAPKLSISDKDKKFKIKQIVTSIKIKKKKENKEA